MSIEQKQPAPLWQRLLIGANPRRTILRAVVLVVAAVVLLRVLVPVRVSGTSMEPTIRDGKITVINRIAYLGSAPKRGDVVAVRWAGNRAWLLKRIIALPGESFQIERNSVRVNGKALDEPYANWGDEIWQAAQQKLEADEYLVIGDNRDMPQSEHEFGRASRGRILGKALF